MQKNGQNYPFVKPVRTNSDGRTEMILSNEELNVMGAAFIPEDLAIPVEDGTTFVFWNGNQKNQYEINKWLCICESELIVPMRDARDEKGDLIIDGGKKKYGLAELWVDIPGEESAKSVSRKKLITKAWTFIENDSAEGRLTKIKLLGKVMRNAPDSDVMDYLYQISEKNPNQIIELYTSSDMALKLLLIDAKENNVIRKKNGMFVYADDTIIGSTDEAAILFLKMPTSKNILDQIKFETYPDMVQKVGKADNKPKKEE